ncbi:MAG: IclR family transcriptional regulator [Reyranellaceae bacterium]
MTTMETGAAVKAASRTLDIIEAFARRATPLSLSELAGEIGAPLSSCHGIARTLQARGYLYALEKKRRLYPTRKLYETAAAVARHDPLLERLRPFLTALRDATGETVVLARREGDEVVYLDVLESPQTIRYATRAGERKPIHSSSLGKALLSLDERASFDAFLARAPLRPITPDTIVDPELLWRQLVDSRSLGYITSMQENVIDVTAISMLIDVDGETLALASAGPIARYKARFAENLAALQATVERLRQAGIARPIRRGAA